VKMKLESHQKLVILVCSNKSMKYHTRLFQKNYLVYEILYFHKVRPTYRAGSFSNKILRTELTELGGVKDFGVGWIVWDPRQSSGGQFKLKKQKNPIPYQNL
jgi:hypothetical protein